MQYIKTIEETCELIRARLEATGLLPGGAYTVVLTGFENLWKVVPELTRFPAALVSPGRVAPEELSVAQAVEIAIFVVDDFRGIGDQAASGAALMDAIRDSLTGDMPGQSLDIEGVHFLFDSIRPVPVKGGDQVGWQITLEAKMSFKQM